MTTQASEGLTTLGHQIDIQATKMRGQHLITLHKKNLSLEEQRIHRKPTAVPAMFKECYRVSLSIIPADAHSSFILVERHSMCGK